MASDELHQLRQAKATELSAMNDRHGAERHEFNENYQRLLRELGLDDSEVLEEWMAMVREATPTSREYDLTGLEEDDEDAGIIPGGEELGEELDEEGPAVLVVVRRPGHYPLNYRCTVYEATGIADVFFESMLARGHDEAQAEDVAAPIRTALKEGGDDDAEH